MKQRLTLILLGAALLLPGLGRLTIERTQELRVALVARDMAEGGSWLVPRFQRQPRLRKPPLMYWLAAAPCVAAGRTDSPTLVRLPSVAAGLALLLLVHTLGRRALGHGAGFAAAGVLALSFGFVRHARLGETDMLLSLCVAAAIAAGLVALRRGGWTWWALCGTAAGLGFLTKGPAALVLPPLILGIHAITTPRARRTGPGVVLAAACFAAIALPWYIFLWNNAAAREAVASEARALVHTAHPGTVLDPPLYLAKLLLPWSLLLPWALWSAWRERRHHGVRLALTWLTAVLAVLMALPSKQEHYALLALPPAALLVGHLLPRLRWPVWAFAPAALVVAAYVWFLYPRTNDLARVPAFMAAVRPGLDPDRNTHVVGIDSAIFEFYAGHVMHNIDSARAAWDRAAPGETILVIQSRKRLPAEDLPPAEPVRTDDNPRLWCREYRKSPPSEPQPAPK